MKTYEFKVTFSNGNSMNYSCNAESYLAAYLQAVRVNVKEVGDKVVPK